MSTILSTYLITQSELAYR